MVDGFVLVEEESIIKAVTLDGKRTPLLIKGAATAGIAAVHDGFLQGLG